MIMNLRNRKLLTTILLSLLSVFTANAQLMWNVKGGIMPVSYTDGYDKHNGVDWMAGLELEIPLSTKLNLETGLRYKHHYALTFLDENDEYYSSMGHLKSVSHLELPLRITYKYPLNDNFMLRAGIGPYASYSVGQKMGEKWHNSLIVGLEPAVAVDWKAISIGLSYNLPCIKGYKDENNNSIMFTIGIRFSSRVWSSIGDGIVKFDDAMRHSGTYDAIESMGSNAGTNTYQSTYPNNNENSPTNISGGNTSNKNKYSINEQQNYNTDKETWGRYDSMLSQHFYGSLAATKKQVIEWQQKMKDLRTKWKAKGKSFPNSTNENHTISGCPNTSHSH